MIQQNRLVITYSVFYDIAMVSLSSHYFTSQSGCNRIPLLFWGWGLFSFFFQRNRATNVFTFGVHVKHYNWLIANAVSVEFSIFIKDTRKAIT